MLRSHFGALLKGLSGTTVHTRRDLMFAGLGANRLLSVSAAPASLCCHIRDASFLHGEEQEGAHLPPAPELRGRLQPAGHASGTHMLR